MARGELALAEFGAGGAGAQSFELVLHFRSGVVGGFGQSLVELDQGFADGGERSVERGAGAIESFLQFYRQDACGNLLAQSVFSLEQVSQRERVAIEERLQFRLDDGGREARQDRGNVVEKFLVDDGS